MADTGGGGGGAGGARSGGEEVRVDVDRIGKAVDALLRWVAGAREQQRLRLLDEDQLLYLVVSLKNAPAKAKVSPLKIPIPHPIYDPDGGGQEICLIVNDLSRGMLRKDAKERVALEGIRVSRVLGFSKMKKDFATHESKRKLCGSYDLFLVDRKIQPFLSKALGKVFYNKKKIPIPIDLSRGQWKRQIESVCGSTFLFLSAGTCSVVKAARMSQAREEIVENLVAVIDGVVGLMPKKWESVLALHLKTIDSLALPLYQSSPSFPVKIDVNAGKKHKLVKLAPAMAGKKVEGVDAAAPSSARKHQIEGDEVAAGSIKKMKKKIEGDEVGVGSSKKKKRVEDDVLAKKIYGDEVASKKKKKKIESGDLATNSSKKKKIEGGDLATIKLKKTKKIDLADNSGKKKKINKVVDEERS